MPTPEDFALAASSSANDALLSALLATAKAVLTNVDEVAAAQWAADAYTYMLNSRGNITNVTFDGFINAGTSNVPIGKVQLRRDLAGSWTVANPLLSIGEFGIETDTRFIKIGNGLSYWIDLPYISLPKSSISGINNIDNTSDVNKPVSTLQAIAITFAINTAKAYTDTSSINHFVDVGEYSVSLTNAYPIDGGTGTLGAILRGNVFNIIGSGTINSYTLSTGDSLRALVDNPTQSDTDWLVTTKPLSNTKPYIVVLNIPGTVMSDFVFPSHIFTLPVSFAIDFALSKAHSRIYATYNYVFTIRKNGINIGTLTFATGTSIGVFVATSSSSFIAGDIIEIKSQLISDPSLSDVTISLLGSRI